MQSRTTQLDDVGDLLAVAADALQPPPQRSLWEWAEANVMLTPKTGTFSPGLYKTRHTPHVREPMEAFRNPDVREVVLPWAAQTGKTLTETICAAWTVANDPGNALVVMPSEQMAKSFSQNRLQRVLQDTGDTAPHILRERGKFNKLEMELDNCVFALAGAGSASNLASRPVRYLFLDETDKYPEALAEEGNPISLAKERTKTFANKKIFETSTITTEGGAIWQEWLLSSQHEWRCRCPRCGEFFTPTWKDMVFPLEGTDNERAAQCHIDCPKCGLQITEAQRRVFVTGGRWERTSEGQEGVEGFRISEICSGIGRAWPELVKMFLGAARKAKSGNSEAMRAFVCSVLAEPWRVETDTMRASGEIMRYADDYEQLSYPTLMRIAGLTVGIDTQDDRFYYVIRAWGGGEAMESWLVDYGEVHGLDELERVVYASYVGEDGEPRRVSAGLMDAMGHRTHEVYEWCRSVGGGAGILPSRGERTLGGGQKMLFVHLDRTKSGRVMSRGTRLARINTTFFKDYLDDKLRVPVEDLGAWHIFGGVSQDYCNQMVSEYRDENGVWQTRGRQTPNHYWDCEVLALAAAVAAKMDRSAVAAKSSVKTDERRGNVARW